MNSQIRKVAVVAGARTPFCKAGGQLIRSSAVQLGVAAARETLMRSGIRPEQVQQIIFGIVSAPVGAPNIAREIALAGAFPMNIPGHTISQACISSNQAITSAAILAAITTCTSIRLTGSCSRPPDGFWRPPSPPVTQPWRCARRRTGSR